MNIEWWMVDGLVGLVIFISAIAGAARGIGDTVLKIAGFVAGVAASVFYSDRVALWLTQTSVRGTIRDHIFLILRTEAAEEGAAEAIDAGSLLGNGVVGGAADPVTAALPKPLIGIASEIADKTADAAADRLTQVAIEIMAFVVVMFAVWILTALIRSLYRALRKNSLILGVMDRATGFVLGAIKGILGACILVAIMVPVMTWVAPLKVPELIDALHNTYVAGIIYDTNPLLLVIKHFLL